MRLFVPEREVWAPQRVDAGMRLHRAATYLKVLGRPKAGVSIQQARNEMEAIAAALAREYPRENGGVGVTLAPFQEHLVADTRPALLGLMAAVGLVLLIACANVASLLLAQGSGRLREMAVRSALGAARVRLIRQLLTESLLLALVGCATGWLLSGWALEAIRKLAPAGTPRIEEAAMDGGVLAFSLALSGITVLIFGLAPALHVSRFDIQSALHGSGRALTSSRGSLRFRSALAGAEIALAVVLLVGAGLLLRSFLGVLGVDPGFAVDRTAAFQVFLWRTYRTPESRIAYVEQALEKLQAQPGIIAAGAATTLPFLESGRDVDLPIRFEGRPAPPPGQEPVIYETMATPGYFRALGIPLLRGRWLTDFDRAGSPPVALINDTAARLYWPGEDPVGQAFHVRQRGSAARLEIVGVVGDVHHTRLDAPPRPEFFQPHRQNPDGSMIFVVRSAGDVQGFLPAIKAVFWTQNARLSFYRVATLRELLADTLAPRRFVMLLSAVFGGLALLLAAVGVYGVFSAAAAQRTPEFGLRAALGAATGDLLRMVLRQSLRVILAGLFAGMLAALALSRLLRTLLWGVQPEDPLTYLAAGILLFSVALAACLFPARRAASVDPAVALRQE